MTIFIFSLEGALLSIDYDSWMASRLEVPEKESLFFGTNNDDVPTIDKLIKRVTRFGSYLVSRINSLGNDVTVHTEIARFIERHSSQCAIASEIPSCWLEVFSQRIDCPFFGPDAVVQQDRISRLANIRTKEDIVRDYKQRHEDRIVFLGSGSGDVDAMREADLSVACAFADSPSSSVMTVSDYILYEENSLCRLLNQLF